jgi:coenzyme F420-0:L-glutamate ligase / coenzyme F420-1:gamma-L-glutamate ligase
MVVTASAGARTGHRSPVTGHGRRRELRLIALPGMPEIGRGAPLARLIADALKRVRLVPRRGDVLVVAQKIVSKAEGRSVPLADVAPSARAEALAQETGKDPRLVELILRESRAVLRAKPGVIVVEHRLGFVMANAGIDQSNVPGRADVALLLPGNPDAAASALRRGLARLCGVEMGVVINDSFGRAWRNGVAGVAIGVAGMAALVDLRGRADRDGRLLRVTQVAAADELAAAASLVMGQADEGTPVVLARGFPYASGSGSGRELIRAPEEDLFR